MNIEINIDALNRDIESLQNLYVSFEKNKDLLNTSMHSLNETWEGVAKEAYLVQYQLDELQIDVLQKMVNEFIQLLKYAAGQYQNCDNKVKSMIMQIQV